MFYAMVHETDGTMTYDVLHVFESAADRNRWVSETPSEPGYGEMWESGDRIAISAREARKDVEYRDGFTIHWRGKWGSKPNWLDDATDGNSMMSPQNRDPKNPSVETYWTNARRY